MAYLTTIDDQLPATKSGNQAFVKSPAISSPEGVIRANNAFSVAKFAYGKPLPNGESSETPEQGYNHFDRRLYEKYGPKNDGKGILPPFDIRPPESETTLRHLKTMQTENGMVSVVYEDEAANTIYIGFKGSATFDEKLFSQLTFYPKKNAEISAQAEFDWATNKDQQLTAQDSPNPLQYTESERQFKKILADHPNSNIVVSGHSKAGGQVQFVMMACQREILEHEKQNRLKVRGYAIDPPPLASAETDLIKRGLLPDKLKDIKFAQNHTEIFQLYDTSGNAEFITEFQNKSSIMNILGTGGNYYGRMNQLFVPTKKYELPSLNLLRNLHLINAAQYALRKEEGLPNGFVYRAGNSNSLISDVIGVPSIVPVGYSPFQELDHTQNIPKFLDKPDKPDKRAFSPHPRHPHPPQPHHLPKPTPQPYHPPKPTPQPLHRSQPHHPPQPAVLPMLNLQSWRDNRQASDSTPALNTDAGGQFKM